MGKIIYDPRNLNKKETEKKVEEVKVCSPEQRIEALIENLNSVRPVGDTDCDYAVYLEDYAYTYIYQYAHTDLACEHSAAIIGEYYPETKEVIICGVMPIDKNKLESADEWINHQAVDALYQEKERYFPGAVILGWLHMQPGYGTMLTMKEVKVHRELFNREGSLLLLVDPINKLEMFYVYENETLKEQSGYYIYYDKNPCMQQYMLDKPFFSEEKEEVDDNVVTQFREIGQRRKREYQQRKKTNFTVIAASVALLAMAAVLLRIGEQDKLIGNMMNQLESVNVATKPSLPNNEAVPPFVFEAKNQIDAVEVSGQMKEDEKVNEKVNEKVDELREEEEGQVVEQAIPNDEKEKVDLEESKDAEDTEEDAGQSAMQEEVIKDNDQEEKYRTYVVENGDTLRKISLKHFDTELRTKDIIALNELENGDHIYVGQEIKVPLK